MRFNCLTVYWLLLATLFAGGYFLFRSFEVGYFAEFVIGSFIFAAVIQLLGPSSFPRPGGHFPGMGSGADISDGGD